ncbi:hypothetical protein Nepgr_002884 [Nepenthes gracilis]|uniref:AIPP2-like SPOC-like domain-containing protein n=1 Tax=Nepenthes gracilis TaxID=150966 RepID=A0AAD3P8I2_NEPGR|nr:hypothetical protein Nepgr_002884 [Nepenthes gracilis]
MDVLVGVDYPSEMNAICQKCGDRGFPETLVCCFKCHNAYEHRYCFNDASKIFEGNIQWACEDCFSSNAKQLVIDKPGNWQPRKRKRISLKNVRAREAEITHQGKSKAKMRSKETERVPSVLIQGRAQIHKRGSFRHHSKSLVKIASSDHDLINNGCTLNEQNSSIPYLTDDEAKDSKPKHKKRLNMENGYASKQASFADNSASQTVPDGLSTISKDCSHIPAQPIVDPIWKGSFSIHNEKFGIVDGVVAHLSSKACLKVREEACLLPTLLNSDILQKTNVWPKSFQQSQPSDDSIGLYFFPEKERDEKVFNLLVDGMMVHDLAMRCVVENAELLVFTSIELPLGFWRFQGNHYLWGVFRAKEPSCPTSVATQ